MRRLLLACNSGAVDIVKTAESNGCRSEFEGEAAVPGSVMRRRNRYGVGRNGRVADRD